MPAAGKWKSPRFPRPERRGLNPVGAVTGSEGGIWIAKWGAGAVMHYRPEGRRSHHIAVDAQLASVRPLAVPNWLTGWPPPRERASGPAPAGPPQGQRPGRAGSDPERSSEIFDLLPDGRPVNPVRLRGAKFSAMLLTMGARVQNLRMEGVAQLGCWGSRPWHPILARGCMSAPWPEGAVHA